MHTTLQTTLARIHEEEDGAQAMEYAALAGGGVSIITILIQLLRSEPVQGAISGFLTGLFEGLAGSLGTVF